MTSRPINERLTIFVFEDIPRWDEVRRSFSHLTLIVNDDAKVQNPQSWDGGDQLVGFADEDHFSIFLMADDAIAEPEMAAGLYPVLIVDGGMSTFPVPVTRAEQIHKGNAIAKEASE